MRRTIKSLIDVKIKLHKNLKLNFQIMSTENTTPTPPPTPEVSGNKPAEDKPAAFTLMQKAQLVKKKYEYENQQGMDAAAAEAAARKDLGLPEMTAAEKEESAKPNIFQKMLKSKLFAMLGITALLSGKKEELKKELKKELKLVQPDQNSPSAETAENKPAENPLPQNPQPEVKPTENSPAKIFSSADETSKIKPEDKPPVQPENQNPLV